MYGFGGLFVLSLLFFLMQAAVQALKDRHTRKMLLAEIGKREELVENGHFVTAYELTQKYLKYFPDDTEIRAFQQRLLDFTNNDPKTAQKAFVEAKKLQARLTQFADDPRKLLLDQQEKSTIQALLPYHPELNNAYHKLLQLEEGARKRLTVEQQLEEAQSALRGGYLFKAQCLLEQIEQQQPDAPQLEVRKNECQLKLQEAEQAFENVRAFFVLGKLSEGWTALEGFLRQYKDHPQALEAQEDARQFGAQRALVLRWPQRNWQLRLFLQNELIFGRQDDGAQPDLAFDDRRISRQHATLRLVNGQVEITDNGSTGGTYINGQKITSAVLKNGDVLNLAKIKEFKVHQTQEPDGKTTGILFTSGQLNWALGFTHLIFTPQPGAGRADQAKWQVFFDGNVPVLIHGDRFAVLLAGKTIQWKNETIEVEAI
ncbi:MAG: FHA domain-containing protein [Alphaproteobacteria bacterium]